MGKIGNQVYLSGTMKVTGHKVMPGVQGDTPVINCLVQIREFDGEGNVIVHEHPVIGFGRLAVEVWAFYTEAVNKAEHTTKLTKTRFAENFHLQSVVDGHLMSGRDGKSVMIADRVQFFVSAEQRSTAVRMLNNILSGNFRSEVPSVLQFVDAIVQES